MLQIITGKFYDSDDRFHNDCKGILYSNISFSGIQEMGHIKIQSAEACGNISSYVISYDNQLQKSHGNLELIKVGDEEIFRQLKNILSFGLNAVFDEDRATVERICKKKEDANCRYPVPSEFIRDILDIRRSISDDDLNTCATFFTHLMRLGREDYTNILNCIVAYNASIRLLNEDISLSYSMLVYCMESLAQSYDAYVPTWEDYKEDKKKALEKIFKTLDEESVEKIKEILIKDEHLKLSKRFKEFVGKYIGEKFFEYCDERKTVGKEEFDVALVNAYNSRSKYAHMLKPLMKHLTMAEFSKSGDVFEFQHNVFFTYSGLLRVTRNVICNFVSSTVEIDKEKFDWRGAIPGCLEIEPAPYFWIWKMDNDKGEGAKARVEGLVETFVYYKKNIPKMDNLVKMYMSHLANMKEENRLAAFTLCCLYVGKIMNVEEETKNEFYIIYDKNKELFAKCSIYGFLMIVMNVNLNICVEWDMSQCEKVVNDYCKKRFKSNRLKLPKEIETMIYIKMADGYKQESEKDMRQLWLQRAYDNSNFSQEVQKLVQRSMAENIVFDIKQIWEIIDKRFKK